MKTRIVVDSSSNLYTMEQADFRCVPLKVVTDTQEYLDDAALDAAAMAETLRTYKGKTGTSCPNVADWLEAYEGAEQLVVITITGTLSGSYNAALLAGEEYRETCPGARVFGLDSLSAGPEIRLLAEKARELVNTGRGCWASGSSGRPATAASWKCCARPAASTARWNVSCWN